MSKFPGGIFSKARGKTSGIVFSAARTRQGKLMTSRALVIPANPQTPEQQSNRSVFDFVQRAVRSYGPAIYRTGFNRSVEDLPGYQSLLSIIRRSYNESIADVWTAVFVPSDTLLGDLHFPDSIVITFTGTTDLNVTWSTETGENGAAGDTIHVIAAGQTVDVLDDEQWTWGNDSGTRNSGGVSFEGRASWHDGALIGIYAESPLNPEGERRSVAKWFIEIN